MKWYDRWKLLALPALAAIVVAGATSVHAATNTASGDIAGVAADLGNSNTFTLNAQALALIKRAFLTDGTPITSGATLPRGTTVRFMIYVNNNTAFAVNDMSVQDVLAANFVYQPGTIKVDNSVNNCAAVACTGAEEAAIYTAVNGAAAKTDAVDPDVVSYTGGSTTIDAGNQTVANGQLNVSANKVWAVLFTVVMQ
jgi:uncharacterized repeat protein (TIGR01451 family)